MTNRTSLIIVLVAIVSILTGGIFVWRGQHNKSVSVSAANLEAQILKEITEEDIKLILENEQYINPQLSINELKTSPEARQEYLRLLRGTLGLAAQARREGLTDKSEFEILLGLTERASLARLYDAKKNKGQPSWVPLGDVTKEEIEALWSKPEMEEQFGKEVNTQLAARQAISQAALKDGGLAEAPKLKGEQLEKARDRWARATIIAEKAKADTDFTQKREIQLQLKLQEARLLASEYLALQLDKQIEPTNQEIAAYIALHPEYDVSKKREKAESVFERARSGEDFVKLVGEFNEFNLNGDRSGLQKDVNEAMLPPQFREDISALEKGNVANRLIETQLGYHIVKVEGRKIVTETNGAKTIKITIRQILIRNKFQAPTKNIEVPPPFERAEDIARRAIKEEKRRQLTETIAQRNGIKLPQDISI